MAISFATSYADLGKVMGAFASINGMAGAQLPISSYVFTVTAANATIGATYTNNSQTFTVLSTIAGATVLFCSGTGAPLASGTLTKATGTGDATITYSANTNTPTTWGGSGPIIKEQTLMVSDIITRLQGAGLTSLLPFQGWQGILSGMDTQSFQSQKTALQALAQQIIITRVNNDNALQSQTFQQAIVEWIRQMQSASSTVKQAVVSATVTTNVNNTGNPIIYASILDKNGLNLEYTLPETWTLKCTQDKNHGATAGSEQITVVSPAPPASSLSYLWPIGSGLNAKITVVDPTQGYGSGGNLIGGGLATVGAFKAFTGAVPNGWVADIDPTNISDGTTNNYSGLAHCLQFTGNTGGTNLQTAVYQNFANGAITGGSSITILPETVYHFTMRCKASVVPAAGVITISLTDGSGTVINNNNGTANSIVVTVSAFGGTLYTSTGATVSGSFQTPTNLPANVRLRIKATTPITTGTNLFMDFAALSQPTAQGNGYGGLYPGGPYLSATRGSADCLNFVTPTLGDYWTILMANDNASSSPTPLSFQAMFNQLFGMASLGLILPSNSAPSIANSLIS